MCPWHQTRVQVLYVRNPHHCQHYWVHLPSLCSVAFERWTQVSKFLPVSSLSSLSRSAVPCSHVSWFLWQSDHFLSLNQSQPAWPHDFYMFYWLQTNDNTHCGKKMPDDFDPYGYAKIGCYFVLHFRELAKTVLRIFFGRGWGYPLDPPDVFCQEKNSKGVVEYPPISPHFLGKNWVFLDPLCWAIEIGKFLGSRLWKCWRYILNQTSKLWNH